MKRLLTVLFALAVSGAGAETIVAHPQEKNTGITINGEKVGDVKYGDRWFVTSGALRIGSGDWTLSGKNTKGVVRVEVVADANITLKNLQLKALKGQCAFALKPGVTVNLYLQGENELESGANNAGVNVPYVTKYYDNTVVGYSWSKSLSLPGERIGYLVFPSELADFENAIQAANIANRVLGYVNAPTLIQRVVARCIDCKVNVAAYDRNRQNLYDGLVDAGYECVYPEGAFYLFVKSPIDDDVEFCARAKAHNILVVPGKSFACPGYVRIAYCVSHETIMNSIPAFAELMKEIKEENKE